jgi:hypothetical protein
LPTRSYRPLLDADGVDVSSPDVEHDAELAAVYGSLREAAERERKPLREEGFAACARRIGGPYRRAVAEHFDHERPTYTERALGRLARDV